MANTKQMAQWSEELEKKIRLKTFPFAVKMLEKEEDIPEGAVRPVKDLGQHMELCQAFATSRRMGTTMAMMKEDMWCFEPVFGYGLVEPHPYFIDGHNRYPADVVSMEAGKNYASDMPRMPSGKYVGIVSAPLKTANFIPDVVLIYCDSAQLSYLLLAREYKDGHDLKCSLSGHAACVYSVVPVMKTGQAHVAISCRGDRYIALAGDEEVIFSLPFAKMEDLIEGIRFVENKGNKFPPKYRMSVEAKLPENYLEIAQMVGLLKDKTNK